MTEDVSNYRVTDSLEEDIEVLEEINDTLETLTDLFMTVSENTKDKDIRKTVKLSLNKIDEIYDDFINIMDIVYGQMERRGEQIDSL